MLQGRPLFNVFGVPVVVGPMFFLFLLLLGFLGSQSDARSIAIWVAIGTAAVLLHEAGHATTIRLFGYGAIIELVGFGGLTHWIAPPGPAIAPWKRLVVSLSGPFASVLGGLVVLGIGLGTGTSLQGGGLASTAFLYGLVTTFGWGIFNLIPIIPFDGGNAMNALLTWFFGTRGTRAAHVFSVLFGVALCALAAWQKSAWIAVIVGLSTWRNVQATLALWSEPAAPPAPLPPDFGAEVERGLLALDRGDAEAALAIGETLSRASASPIVLTQAAELIAWAHLARGRAEEARRAIAAIPPGSRADPAVEGVIQLELGHPNIAIPLLEAALARRPSERIAAYLERARNYAGRETAG